MYLKARTSKEVINNTASYMIVYETKPISYPVFQL